MAKNKEKKEEKGDKAKKGGGFKTKIFLIAIVFLGLIFLPTSFLLLVGLIPSWVAIFIGAITKGTRAATIMAMNLAGCVPFVLQLWATEHTFERSISLISDPQVISIIFTAALFGYLIDWVVTGLVSSYLYQKGRARMKAISKRQDALIDMWGEGVKAKVDEELSF